LRHYQYTGSTQCISSPSKKPPYNAATIAPSPTTSPAPTQALAVSAAPPVLRVELGEPVALGTVPFLLPPTPPVEPATVPFDAAPAAEVCITVVMLVE